MALSFNLSFAILLAGGWLSGRLFKKIGLPGVMGMVVFGILCSVWLKPYASPLVGELAPSLKSFALIVILLRAGLGIGTGTLKTVGLTAALMSSIPCLFEGMALTALLHFLIGFPWDVAGLTGFMLAAVSPAVVVPSMLELIAEGRGKRHAVPTVVLAGASADDVFAITLFSVFLGLARDRLAAGGAAAAEAANGGVSLLSVAKSLAGIPVSLIVGVLAGLAAGYVVSRAFERFHASIRATEKALLLIVGASLLVQIGDALHFAALIGIMAAGFVILARHEEIAHELASKLSKVWVFAEIVLFVLIGFSLDPARALEAGPWALGIIAGGLAFRSLGVFVATAFSPLTAGERLFCAIAYLPKATVQAALGGVALSFGIPEGQTVLAVAVVAILFTAPLGLIGIRLTARRLLKVEE